ncbi:MAG: hypothetical protein II095_05550 [Bacteroidales bacterium]|nr:hypothetical protein [Bacteroidales bacterium]
MKTRKLILSLACALACAGTMNAQTIKSQTVQGGGTGAYKAVVVADESLPDFTIYRPADLKAAVAEVGKLPIVLYANGACANDNQQMRYLLNEVVSHGYFAIAIGPYDEGDVDANWDRVFHPEKYQNNRPAAGAPRKPTSGNQLLEAMDWLAKQYANPESEYYHMVDLQKVAAMGQSCGGAQALSISYDPRIKTTIMLNSGMGEVSMGNASKKSLENLHAPILYLNGGPTDIAYKNAKMDYARLKELEEEFVAMVSTTDGHHGTYSKPYGGDYAIAVLKWIDWQLKGEVGQSALFLDPEYIKLRFPDWTLE